MNDYAGWSEPGPQRVALGSLGTTGSADARAQGVAGGILSSPPSISLPKGGGAIRSMGEKFSANPVTGTSSLSVPIYTSVGRSGFGTQLSLSYDSGAGNGPFGFGWSFSASCITRETDKGLPRPSVEWRWAFARLITQSPREVFRDGKQI